MVKKKSIEETQIETFEPDYPRILIVRKRNKWGSIVDQDFMDLTQPASSNTSTRPDMPDSYRRVRPVR